jgi:hypothetical protein
VILSFRTWNALSDLMIIYFSFFLEYQGLKQLLPRTIELEIEEK